MIEAVFGLVIATFSSFIYTEIRDLRKKMDTIEDKLILLTLYLPKREADRRLDEPPIYPSAK